MAKQVINIGTIANDDTGDPLRTAFDKCNDNFTETYGVLNGTGAGNMLTLAAGTTSLGNTTLASATPTLIFKDSSCAAAANNATIAAAATDTGDGTEDIDVTFSQQVNGALTAFLTADADGAIAVGQAGQAISLQGSTTVSSATPTLTFKDSDCAESDPNATILVAATTTTAAHEDIDVTFSQQVDGTLTEFLKSDADGSLTIGQTGQAIVLNGPVGNTIIRSDAPSLSFKDSDCADSEINAQILAAATTTTSNLEDIDVSLKQQVGGTLVSFITSTAGGTLALGYGGQVTTMTNPIIANADPSLNFKDSSCAESDVNAQVLIEATDTGAGAEDINVTLKQQIAGVLTAFLTADADGSITLGSASQPVAIAALSATQITHNSRVVPSSITFTPAAGAADVCEVTISVCNSAGTPIARVFNMDLWLADVATAEGLTSVTTSGNVVAKAASGTDLLTYTAKKALRVQTLATGVYVLSITDTAHSPFYIAAQVGDLVGIGAPLIGGNYGSA